ncbi:unnamed protein product [Peniophora sp. CBMAI 1063]|nr:unnamed protein product [Peniophora sp. CBMAI 1063]
MCEVSKERDSAESTTRSTHDFAIFPIPKRLRHDPARPPQFGTVLNIVFAFTSTFVIANLYYSQPLLIQLAQSFGVTYDEISRVPTLVQGGFGAGLVFIAPLGDLSPRRPLLLLLVGASMLITVGLAVTKSFLAFQILNFLIGVVSLAPQILVPLAADLAPSHRRATAISIVISGLLLGILISRVMAGIVAQFVSWRIVYYVSVGMQAISLASLWATVPDYPSQNKELTYAKILWSVLRLSVTEPTLIQAALVQLGGAAVYTEFFVTLTFLLGDNPYNYDTLIIGIFGLIGLVGVCGSPIYGRIIDRVTPWHVSIVTTLGFTLTYALYWGAAGVNIAVPVIVTFGLDVFRQSQQTSLAARVFELEDGLRSRLNAVCMIAIFLGQVIGSAVGSEIFLKHGWRANGALMTAFCLFQLAVLLVRGPHVPRYTWFGYAGGLKWIREDIHLRAADEERASASVDDETRAPSVAADTKSVKRMHSEHIVGASDIQTVVSDAYEDKVKDVDMEKR